MTGDDWQKLAELAGVAIVAGFIALKSHRAEMQAKKAKEYSQPTGNGFAGTVKDALTSLQQTTERIEAAQAKDSIMLYDHIRAHANADVMKGAHRESPSDPNSP